ncbi:hypothetical protein BK816_00350 [Boudabousia tangfeifanii]|uniref:ABC transporter domain-containing protein n=1 Tax=Boudabousia tangfeifanii TaxID=1912795 RepID=A0A1D9MM90_9ACTO|nr:hypothetical protein BK816_00350 [Boudabousia tangfeifanii]
MEIPALRGIDLTVPAGAALALMGPSGCGKSTLLQLLGAFDLPTEGEIRVGDTKVHELKGNAGADYRASIGFIFQQFHLIDTLPLVANVALPLVGRQAKAERQERAMALLDFVGLADRAESLPTELSGGQQQRVAIARALVNEPKLVLADEPTGNLDSQNANEIIALLSELHDYLGVTLLVATHDPQVADKMQGTIRMQDGLIVG